MSLMRTAAAALLLAACSMHDGVLQPTASVEPGTPWLRTDRNEYTVVTAGAWRTVEFDLAYQNYLDVPVAVPSCHNPVRPVLEKHVAGAWVHAHAPVELMCLTAPLRIAAGETHRFRYTLRIDEWDLRNWPATSGDDSAGSYRLVWLVGIASGPGRDAAALPIERRASNEFRLRM